MNSEKYNLKWHTYTDHQQEMFHEMMRSEELADVTLICDDMTKWFSVLVVKFSKT